jgi:four helix bundle protein
MFDTFEASVLMIETLVATESKIRKRSSSLAGQISRASESVALNVAEARGRQGGDRRHHWEIAAGSAYEVGAGLRIAVAKGYITRAEMHEVDVVLDRVRAMLYRLTQR